MKNKIEIIECKFNKETLVSRCTIDTNLGRFSAEVSPKNEDLEKPSSFLGCDIARIRAIQLYIDAIVNNLTTNANQIIDKRLQLDGDNERKAKKYNRQYKRMLEKIEKYNQKKMELEQNINDLVIARRVQLKMFKKKD